MKCKHCGKSIVFMRTKSGKSMPVNAETVSYGDEFTKFYDSKIHISHFSDCPGAEKFRRPKGKMTTQANQHVPQTEENQLMA